MLVSSTRLRVKEIHLLLQVLHLFVQHHKAVRHGQEQRRGLTDRQIFLMILGQPGINAPGAAASQRARRFASDVDVAAAVHGDAMGKVARRGAQLFNPSLGAPGGRLCPRQFAMDRSSGVASRIDKYS